MAGWHHGLDGCLSELRELVVDREACRFETHGVSKSRTQSSDWTKLFMSLLAICMYLWRNVFLVLWPIFLIGLFIFLELSCISCLYIFEISCLEKTLMLGKIEGRRRRGQQRMRLLDGITDSMDLS